jgi:hypothetical protein
MDIVLTASGSCDLFVVTALLREQWIKPMINGAKLPDQPTEAIKSRSSV